MLGCSLGWWVAMDRGGAGTISQLFRTLTVDLFSHNPPISHYSLLTPLTPPLLLSLSLSFFLALSHTTSLSAPPPPLVMSHRGEHGRKRATHWQRRMSMRRMRVCIRVGGQVAAYTHTHIHTQWKRQTLHQHTQSDVRMLNLMHRVRRVTKSKIRNERKGYSTGRFTVGHFRNHSWQPALMDLCCLASSTTLSAH